jgi:predicted metal-dependent phosphoesterase TrpH
VIDLHTHTTESDGSFSPEELIAEARRVGLDALAITDHDTFLGYEKAIPFAQNANLDLIRGIELNSRLLLDSGPVRWAHILAYFPDSEPSRAFTGWLQQQRAARRDRNVRLAESLRQHGIDISVEEVEARGRSLAGRPHFARILVEKGYVVDINEAFDRYIGEDAPAFVERESPMTESLVRLVRDAGGIPVVAHPVRLSLDVDELRTVLRRLKDDGLLGLEIYHSEQNVDLQNSYRELAEQLDLLPTGGSDFHGTVKPDTALGSGRNRNVLVPREFLDGLLAYSRQAR